jgi:hypothetical protein
LQYFKNEFARLVLLILHGFHQVFPCSGQPAFLLPAFVLVTIHSLQRRRNASSTFLWIFIAWSVPVIESLVYLSFGIDRVGERGFLKFLTDQHLLETRKENREAAPRAYWHNLVGAPTDGKDVTPINNDSIPNLGRFHSADFGVRRQPKGDGALCGGTRAVSCFLLRRTSRLPPHSRALQSILPLLQHPRHGCIYRCLFRGRG